MLRDFSLSVCEETAPVLFLPSGFTVECSVEELNQGSLSVPVVCVPESFVFFCHVTAIFYCSGWCFAMM